MNTRPNIQVPDEAYRTLCQRAADSDRLRAIIERPIDMVLHCPNCGLQHVDRPDAVLAEGREIERTNDLKQPWTNPPHKSHLCRKEDGGCGFIWRPADVPTNGVQAVKTKGEKDDPMVKPLGPDEMQVRLGSNREIVHSQHYKSGAVQVTTKLKVERRRGR